MVDLQLLYLGLGRMLKVCLGSSCGRLGVAKYSSQGYCKVGLGYRAGFDVSLGLWF